MLHRSSALLSQLPRTRADVATGGIGIHALEVYTPRHCVSADALEEARGCPGKYTSGLMMEQYSVCDDNEDAASMALTAVQSLMRRFGLHAGDIGMLAVGTESLLDRSKSIKTEVLTLLEVHGNNSVEGVDSHNASYGGTSALLQCVGWVEGDGDVDLVE